MKKLLLIEKDSAELSPFISNLHHATHASIYHALTPGTGIAKLIVGGGSIDLVIITVESGSEEVTQLLSTIRMALEGMPIRMPNLMILAKTHLPLPIAAKCRYLQIPCVLRSSDEEIFREVNLTFWMMATNRFDVTFRIERRNGKHAVFLFGPTLSEPFQLSEQLLNLFLYLANGHSRTYPTNDLADALGVCRQTVKKYMAALRVRYDVLIKHALAVPCGRDVFRTTRGHGGTLHSLRANVVWW